MKRILLSISAVLAAIAIQAMPVKPGICRNITLADGTVVKAELVGDEHLTYWRTADGACYRQTPSAGVFSKVELSALQSEYDAVVAQKAAREKAILESARTSMPVKKVEGSKFQGKKKCLVILANFADTKFKPEHTLDLYKQIINGENYSDETLGFKGSVRDYFKAQSGGQFEIDFDVVGPVDLPKGYAGYGKNDASGRDQAALVYPMVEDAVNLAKDQVTDWKQYDWDGDGLVEEVFVLYAGHGQATYPQDPDLVWPHKSAIDPMTVADGVKVSVYACSCELGATEAIDGIGAFCHEFSHCMGLPDLYPKSGSIAEACINQNMDYWSLMDAGEYTANGYRPTAYTAWERERLGWMEIGTLTGPSNVELKSLDEGGAAFRIYNDKDETGHEYYIVENVQNNGWNKNLFGNGLMVTHVDYLSSQFSLGGCKVNNTGGHPRMHVMAADGMFVPEYFLGSTIEDSYITFLKEHNADLVAKYGGQVFSIEDYKAEAAGDLFPGTSNATSLTDDSQPMKAWTYNGETMGKPITDITNDTEKGIVSFKFMGGGEPVDGINEVTVNKTTDSRVYSISGTYMGNDINSLPKGIYIRNGKKVINN